MARSLDDLLVGEASRNLADLPDTNAAMDAEYERGERTYRKSLTDVSKNLASEAIRRNVYTQGGELDKGVQRAFDEVYATPLGDFTRGLAIDAAKQRFANRQTAIQTGQGVSTAQEGARQARRTLSESGRQFDVQQSGVMTDAPQVDAGGNWVQPSRRTTDWLPPEPAADTRASMVGGPGGTKAPPAYPEGQPAPVTGRASLARPTVAEQPAPRLTLAGARQAADIAQQKIGNVITSAAAQGKAAVVNPDGTLQTNPDGSVKLVDSLDAQRLKLQTTETMGGYTDANGKWVPTLQGRATTQDIASKRDADQRAWIEMYGGGVAPVTFTADEWQAAPIGSKQGDQNYDARWDQDGDGEITRADVEEIGGNSKDVGNGVFQYTPAAAAGGSPRTLEGQKLDVQSRELAGRLGLDTQKFKEAQDEFTRTLKLDRQKFLTDASGFVYDENGQPVGMKNPDGTTRPMTTLDRDKFTEMRDEFNANFDEAQYKLDVTLGLDQRQIDATLKAALNADNLRVALGIGQIAATLLTAGSKGSEALDLLGKGVETAGAAGGAKGILANVAKAAPYVAAAYVAWQITHPPKDTREEEARANYLEEQSSYAQTMSNEDLKILLADIDKSEKEDPNTDVSLMRTIYQAEYKNRLNPDGTLKAFVPTAGTASQTSMTDKEGYRKADFRARPQSRSSLVTAPGQPYNFATQQPNVPGFDPKLSPPPQPPVTPVVQPVVRPPVTQPPQPPVKTQEELDAEARTRGVGGPVRPETFPIVTTNKARTGLDRPTDLVPDPGTTILDQGDYEIMISGGVTYKRMKGGTWAPGAPGRASLASPPPPGQLPGGPQPPSPGTGGVITNEGPNKGQGPPEAGNEFYPGGKPTRLSESDIADLQAGVTAGKYDMQQVVDFLAGNSTVDHRTSQGLPAGGPIPGYTTPPGARNSLVTASQAATVSRVTGGVRLGDGTMASVGGDDSVTDGSGRVIGKLIRGGGDRYTNEISGIQMADGTVVPVNMTWDQLSASTARAGLTSPVAAPVTSTSPWTAPANTLQPTATPQGAGAIVSKTTGGVRMPDGTAARVDGQENLLDAQGRVLGRLVRDADGKPTGFQLSNGTFIPSTQTWDSI